MAIRSTAAGERGTIGGMRELAWTDRKPFVAGYYWFLRPDALGMTTMVKVWFDESDGWVQYDCDTQERGRIAECEGQYYGPLRPPLAVKSATEDA